MKFAIINDMHIGPVDAGYKNGVKRKLTQKAEELVAHFVQEMNAKIHPEFVICLGDAIEDVNDKNVDIESYKRMLVLFKPLEAPIHFMIGNHDIRTFSEQEVATLVGQKDMHYSFDHDGYHMVLTSFEMTENHTQDIGAISAKISNDQLKWLQQDLERTSLPTIVFQHYGLADDDMKGNFWFEDEPHRALLENRAQVRDMLRKHSHIKAVFTAHQHWNRMHIHDDIPYFTITSLIENFRNDGIPTEAYTIVTIDDTQIVVDVKGNDPAKFTYTFKKQSK